MDDRDNTPIEPPSLDSVEGGLFDAVFEFHKKVMTLLRAANLDDDKLGIAAERIKLLMAKVTEDIKLTHDLNIQPRLDSMYEEVQRMVDEFSSSQRGGENG